MNLDIGAHVGAWAIRNQPCICVEANYFCEPFLVRQGLDYRIAVLSDTDWKLVDFFLNPNDLISTGSSYKQELTAHFKDNYSIPRFTRKLDSLFPNQIFDLVKLDTQGSELDILKGGIECISKCNRLLIETSVIPYNKNAPLENEVLLWLKEHDFEVENVKVECKTQDIHQNNILLRRVK